MGNLQILGNPRLADISALDPALQCENGQPREVDPKAVLGVVQGIPEQDNPNGTSCLISNAGQASSLSPGAQDNNPTLSNTIGHMLVEDSQVVHGIMPSRNFQA